MTTKITTLPLQVQGFNVYANEPGIELDAFYFTVARGYITDAGKARLITDAERDEVARRLAACWNACQGVSTDLLEHASLMPDYTKQIEAQRDEARAEVERLKALINTPHTDEWVNAVKLEAAHQQERWGAAHDAGKQPQDWFWLLGYLAGKALAAFARGDRAKGLHHIISSSAALLNWHRHATGENTAMRPGIDPVARGVEQTDGGAS